ncbi:MAG: GIY-YIG nuclease family protein [Candidatus Peribacteraceae bacterium]|nr:GIY-YIG nuclease family protein [Candidatus Peribacteraceae bacterium]
MYDFYVYILRCSDGTYYTGVTNSVSRRLVEHNEGRNPRCTPIPGAP